MNLATSLVRDIMSRDVVTVSAKDDLATVLARMTDAAVRRLPVVEQRKDEVVIVGIVSDRDVRLASKSPYVFGDSEDVVAQLRALKVSTIMSTDVATVVPTATVVEAARIMLERRVGGLPVALFSSGRPCLVGIVTRGDILAHLVAWAEAQQVTPSAWAAAALDVIGDEA